MSFFMLELSPISLYSSNQCECFPNKYLLNFAKNKKYFERKIYNSFIMCVTKIIAINRKRRIRRLSY